MKRATTSLEPATATNAQCIVPSVQTPILAQNVSMGGMEQDVRITAGVHVETV